MGGRPGAGAVCCVWASLAVQCGGFVSRTPMLPRQTTLAVYRPARAQALKSRHQSPHMVLGIGKVKQSDWFQQMRTVFSKKSPVFGSYEAFGYRLSLTPYGIGVSSAEIARRSRVSVVAADEAATAIAGAEVAALNLPITSYTAIGPRKVGSGLGVQVYTGFNSEVKLLTKLDSSNLHILYIPQATQILNDIPEAVERIQGKEIRAVVQPPKPKPVAAAAAAPAKAPVATVAAAESAVFKVSNSAIQDFLYLAEGAEAVPEGVAADMETELGRKYATQPKWELAHNADGITLSKGFVPGNAWMMVKLETEMPASATKVMDLIRDPDRIGEYDEFFNTIDLLEKEGPRSPFGPLAEGAAAQFHSKYNGVWPAKPRDFSIITTYGTTEGGETCVITRSIKSDKCPEKKSHVRGRVNVCGFKMTPKDDGTCHMTMIVHTELGGGVPAFLINQMSTTAPLNSIKKMKVILQK